MVNEDSQEVDEERKRTEARPNVYDRLRQAYENNRGIRLSADEVFDLVQMNDAVHTSCFDGD